MDTNHPTAPVDGAGAHVKKCRPSKRIKAAHRQCLRNLKPCSLRSFARQAAFAGDSKDEKLVADWFANKGETFTGDV